MYTPNETIGTYFVQFDQVWAVSGLKTLVISNQYNIYIYIYHCIKSGYPGCKQTGETVFMIGLLWRED